MLVNVDCQFDRIWKHRTDKPPGMNFLDQLSWMGRSALNLHSAPLWAVVLAGLNKKKAN